MNKPDDIESWRLFCHIKELGSISKAALHCQVEASTVSRRLRQLEKDTGMPLFIRSSRALIATDAAEKAYLYMKPLLEQIDQLPEVLSNNNKSLSGIIRVSAALAFGEHILVNWLNAFTLANPDVMIDLRLSNHYTDLINDGIDLAIRTGYSNDDRIITIPLGSMSLICVATPTYLDKTGHPHTPDDLSNHSLLIYTNGQFENDAINLSNNTSTNRLNVQKGIQSNSIYALYSSVLNHAGIALFMPRWLCQEKLSSGELIQVLPDWQNHTHDTYIATKYQLNRPRRLTALIEFLQAQWRETPSLNSTND